MAQVTSNTAPEPRYRGECSACNKWGALRAGVCAECEQDEREADALIAAEAVRNGGYIQ
jgi:predicted ATP-dependent serine protease